MEENKEYQSSQPTPKQGQGTAAPEAMKKVFAVFMLLIYLGMGGLTYAGFFDVLFGTWHWMKWCLGSLFTLYGIWRAYRYFTGRG